MSADKESSEEFRSFDHGWNIDPSADRREKPKHHGLRRDNEIPPPAFSLGCAAAEREPPAVLRGVMRRRRTGSTLWKIALLAGLGFLAGAVPGWPMDLRIEWQTRPAARGSLIAGYVHNETGTTADKVLLRIEGLDDAGRVTSTSTGYVVGTVPPFNRTYFEVLVPTAASYRVNISSFEWIKGAGM